MSVFDLIRQQNSIESAVGPEMAPAPTTMQSGSPTQLGGVQSSPTTPTMADPANIQSSYFIEAVGKERRYYRDLEGKDLAFRADAKAVTTKQEDRATISHMLDVAQSRGWTDLSVRGTAAFKQEVWIEAQARGLSVKGYEPSADDRRNLEARRTTRRQQSQGSDATSPAEPVNVVANATPAATVATGATEQRIEQYQQLIEREQNRVRKAGGDPDAFATAMEAVAVKESGGTPLKASTEPGTTLSDWETAERLASSKVKPREIKAIVKDAGAAAVGPEIANGWTEYEANAMGAYLTARTARDREAQADVKAGAGGERLAGSGEDAAKLSPAAEKVLAFVEQRIETQMSKLSDDVKADLRAYATQALAAREAEAGPVALPDEKPTRKRTAKQDGEQAPKRRKADNDEQQPRMSVG